MSRPLVVFDLDGTLTRKDTLVAFSEFTHGKFISFLIFSMVSPLIALAFMGILKRQFLKELLLKIHYKGKSEQELKNMGSQFAEKVMPALLNDAIYSAMKAHLAEGNTVLVLTASCDVWVEPWCNLQKIEFLGSRMQFNNSVCTGKLVGENCRGEVKVKMMKEYFQTNIYSLEAAYGNEKSDLAVMNLARNKFFVRNGKMEKL